MAKEWVTPRRKFSYDEFKVSKRHPGLTIWQFTPALKYIIRLGVESILDPLRAAVKKSVTITSGHRTSRLNDAVGGSPTSDHLFGCAVDIKVEDMTSYQIAIRLLELGVPYRQIVAYKRKPHCHVSWNIPGRPYKKEVVFA
jgi:hypothetical protein